MSSSSSCSRRSRIEFTRRALSSLLACTAITLAAAGAGAEPLSEARSDSYYVWHGVGTGAALVGALGLTLLAPDQPGPDWALGAWDRRARRNFSESAAKGSDQALVLSVALPVAIQMSDGFDTALGNAALIYGEAQAANILLNSAVKLAFGRPRPYTHSSEPGVQEFTKEQGPDAYASFYSGHSSLSHTAAMTGSILYAMRTDELVARHVVWGLEFALAGVTAQLRVRAGRHYPSDIWTGALVGAGIGFAVPALHGVELERIEATEWVVAGSAFSVTMIGGELLALALGPDEDDDESASAEPVRASPSGITPRVTVLPAAFASGAGIEAIGVF
jgi:membrane-associated phospholipid phosphatase